MKKQTAGRDILGNIAPKFAELNDDILFGSVWSREDKLSARDRGLITIAALFTMGAFPQLKSHLVMGKDHGLEKKEVVEAITQLAFYSGWPKAWSTFPLIEEVYGSDDENEKEKFDKVNVFGLGKPNEAYAKYFIGNSYLNQLAKTDNGISFANVTFEPGCRNNWHIHKAEKGGGQVLICTAGYGYYGEEGKEAKKLSPGDIVVIPANVKHWHGARPDSCLSQA